MDAHSPSLKDFKTWPGPKAGRCVSIAPSRDAHITPATSQGGRWMRARGAHCRTEHTAWPRRAVVVVMGGVGGSVQVWAAHSFCMSVSFHNSSAERDCQAASVAAIHQGLSPSHHNWEMRPQHSNSISPISPGCTAEQPSQPASNLFGNQRDNKTVSANQKQLPSPSSRCHSLRLPVGSAAVLEPRWLTLLFFSVLSHLLLQMKYFCFFQICPPQTSHFSLDLCKERKKKTCAL